MDNMTNEKEELWVIHKTVKYSSVCPFCDTEVHFASRNIVTGFPDKVYMRCPYCFRFIDLRKNIQLLPQSMRIPPKKKTLA